MASDWADKRAFEILECESPEGCLQCRGPAKRIAQALREVRAEGMEAAAAMFDPISPDVAGMIRKAARAGEGQAR